MGKLAQLKGWVFCLLMFGVSRGLMYYGFILANMLRRYYHSNFFAQMCKWDCRWYLSIIYGGYDWHLRTYPKLWVGLANWAFFPLYPIVVKFISHNLHVHAITSGVIVNQVLVLLSLQIFYIYLRSMFDEINSRFGVTLLAFMPFSVYFASLYTEALFMFLSLLAFYFMRKRQYNSAAICGSLLSATRPVGVMFAPVFFIYQIMQHKKMSFKQFMVIGLLSIVSISGLLCYILYLYIHVGDPLAFLHVQSGWGRSGFNSYHLGHQIIHMLHDWYNTLFFMIAFVLGVYLLLRDFVAEGLFTILCILPGVLTGTMLSEARFSGTLFTVYFAIVLLSSKSNSLKIVLLPIFVVMYLAYFLYWFAYANFLI